MLTPAPTMESDRPKYRPQERFWPYAELPEQPTEEELAALDPDLHDALFGVPRNGQRRRDSPSRALLVGRRAEAARALRDRRRLARHRSADRRPSPAVRARALAAAHLVPDLPVTIRARTDRDRTRPAADRGGPQTPGGRVQHVLRRPPAEAAVGNPQPRRGVGQEVRSLLHPELRRSLPLSNTAVALRRLHRSVGSRAARA